jgi:hypothetical protein
MRRILYAVTGLMVLATAACAPAVPTIDPAQVQASAMAAASTMIAMTQAAIPTATDVPPTPIPSPTAFPSPTLAPLPTVASPTAAGTSGDDCNHLFDMAATGNLRTPVKINNQTKGAVNLSLGMYEKNAFGQCGYLGFSVPKGQSIVASMPQTGKGPCWWGYAWVNGPEPSTSQGGPFCWNSTDKYELDIRPDVIRIIPP